MQKFRTIALALSIATLGVAPATASATERDDCDSKRECKKEARQEAREIKQNNRSEQKASSKVEQKNTQYASGGKKSDIDQVMVGTVESKASNKNDTDQDAVQKGGKGGGKSDSKGTINQGNVNVQVAVSNVVQINTQVAVVNGKDAQVNQTMVSNVSSSATNSNSTDQYARQP